MGRGGQYSISCFLKAIWNNAAYINAPSSLQELVEGPVPLKVPHEGDASTNAVSGDGRTYGIASELGAEEAWQRQQAEMAAASAQQQMGGPMSDEEAQVQGPSLEELQRQQLLELLEWEPSGHKYVYNEETGMLQTTGGGETGVSLYYSLARANLHWCASLIPAATQSLLFCSFIRGR